MTSSIVENNEQGDWHFHLGVLLVWATQNPLKPTLVCLMKTNVGHNFFRPLSNL